MITWPLSLTCKVKTGQLTKYCPSLINIYGREQRIKHTVFLPLNNSSMLIYAAEWEKYSDWHNAVC